MHKPCSRSFGLKVKVTQELVAMRSFRPILAMLVMLDIPVPFVALRKLHGMTTSMSKCGLTGTGFAGGPRHQDY